MVPSGVEDAHDECFGVTCTLLAVRLLLPLVVCDGACLLLLPVAPPVVVLPLISLLAEEFIFLCASAKDKEKHNILHGL
jgi:hypothetical protein